MATYRNYAENLIGNWNTDQYQPQRDTALASYRTNWEAIQNDFNNYLDNFRRNLERSRTNYYDTLNAIDKNSVMGVNSAVETLAKRGMLNSGLANRYNQALTAARGQSVNDALDKIINTSTGVSESMANLVKSMGSSENKLNTSLASTLSGITGREQANNQAYQNLAAGIAGNKEARDIANAAAGASKKAQNDVDEEERRIRIADTLMSDKFTDNDKVRYMAMYLDVPADIGEAAVKGYNDNQTIKEYTQVLNKYMDGLYNNNKDSSSTGQRYWNDPTMADVVWGIRDLYREKRANDARNKLEGLSYTDLYNTLYGNK